MLNKKTLYVGGTFDNNFGRSSKIADQVFKAINLDADYFNGGTYHDLEQALESINNYNLIFWFADVPNDKPKLIKDIKKRNKKCVLVTSKRNTEGKYSLDDLVYHALNNKSNLFVEISKSKNNNRYQGRIVDPLGNIFLDSNDNFTLIGKVLGKRAKELSKYTRIGSKRVEVKEENKKVVIPNEKEFFEIVKNYGERFHELIHVHPNAVNRFLGNASYKKEGLIYVSRRNVDKRFIDPESFVLVNHHTKCPVEYFGDKKPSVDTPIQLKLYQFYENVNYMLHGHVYVKDAPMTNNVVPCGAIEEADEVIAKQMDPAAYNFAINLRGHGSILFAKDLDFLKNVKYVPRPWPELHEEFSK